MNADQRRWTCVAMIAMSAVALTSLGRAGEPRLELTPVIDERFPDTSTDIEHKSIVEATLPLTQYIALKPRISRGSGLLRLLPPHPMGRAKVTLPAKDWEMTSLTEVERLVALGFPSAEPRYRIREEPSLAFFGFSR